VAVPNSGLREEPTQPNKALHEIRAKRSTASRQLQLSHQNITSPETIKEAEALGELQGIVLVQSQDRSRERYRLFSDLVGKAKNHALARMIAHDRNRNPELEEVLAAEAQRARLIHDVLDDISGFERGFLRELDRLIECSVHILQACYTSSECGHRERFRAEAFFAVNGKLRGASLVRQRESTAVERAKAQAFVHALHHAAAHREQRVLATIHIPEGTQSSTLLNSAWGPHDRLLRVGLSFTQQLEGFKSLEGASALIESSCRALAQALDEVYGVEEASDLALAKYGLLALIQEPDPDENPTTLKGWIERHLKKSGELNSDQQDALHDLWVKIATNPNEGESPCTLSFFRKRLFFQVLQNKKPWLRLVLTAEVQELKGEDGFEDQIIAADDLRRITHLLSESELKACQMRAGGNSWEEIVSALDPEGGRKLKKDVLKRLAARLRQWYCRDLPKRLALAGISKEHFLPAA
jgi:hypothetical protein